MAEDQQDEQAPDPVVRPGWVLLGNGEQLEVAHLGRRLVAKLVDVLVILLILVLFDVRTEGTIRQAVVDIRNVVLGEQVIDPDNRPVEALFILLGVFFTVVLAYLVAFLYDTLYVAYRGYTPGKGMMHIRIASFDDGSKPRFRQVCKRWIILNPPLWLFFMLAGLVGFLWQLVSVIIYVSPVWNRQRRGWHDKKAGTVVVKAG